MRGGPETVRPVLSIRPPEEDQLSKFRKLMTVGGLAATLALVTVVGALAPSGASSHREALQISQDPVADNTDTYAFVSPDKPDTVTLVGNWIPLEEPAGGPNFHNFGDDVKYTINVDNDGDAVDDIVWEFRFDQGPERQHLPVQHRSHQLADDPDFNIRQTYSVAKVENGRRTVIGSAARAAGQHRPALDAQLRPAGLRGRRRPERRQQGFAGPRDDPFFVDLGSVFDLAGLRPFNQAHLIPRPTEAGVDGVSGYNTHSIVLQVPIKQLTGDKKALTGADDPDAVIGVYAASWRRQTKVLSPSGNDPLSLGQWVQVSRLGMPLVNEVVIPLGKKDRFNASEPADDAQFGKFVLDPEVGPADPGAVPGVKVPAAPRNDIATIFLTGIPGLNQPKNVKPSEMIRLNMGIAPSKSPSPLGVLGGDNAGFPNGRRLADDTPDIELRALAGGTPFTPDFNIAPNNGWATA